MSQRCSPAVQFPLRRGRGLCGVLVVCGVLQLAALAVWLLHGAGHGNDWWWRALAAMAISGLALGAGAQVWRTWPQGKLCWSQGRWWYESAAGAQQPLEGRLQVLWDVGAVLCVRFSLSAGGQRYFWLQRHWASEGWGDLRRAVYSSLKTF